jgi:hypothetical protein
MIAVMFPCQLFSLFCCIGLLGIMLNWKSAYYVYYRYLIVCTLVCDYTYILYITVCTCRGGGAYKYLFSSRETEGQCAECAVRCVYMC